MNSYEKQQYKKAYGLFRRQQQSEGRKEYEHYEARLETECEQPFIDAAIKSWREKNKLFIASAKDFWYEVYRKRANMRAFFHAAKLYDEWLSSYNSNS